uniref:Beta-ketoacyl-[acyl-carrier-protein] synthase III n=1 Tax=Sciadococcus taiwanensis TaxID=3028030 RepID=A0A9Y1MWQ4_9RHOD|nr:3-oxoacyl-acyl-carrier-protein synthase 3 [Sciadococcus taiwanensis]
MHQGINVIGTGIAVPETCIKNNQISTIVETSNEWISNRTGIHQRYISSIKSNLVNLAVEASKQAIKDSKINSEEIDLILLATSTPDDLFGSASQVQAQINAKNAVAFDITAACSGFIISLITAIQYIQTGTYRTILIIGADILSRWIDWSDRSTCILFGDGAGAMLIKAHNFNNILGFKIETDGSQYEHLQLNYSDKTFVTDYQIGQGNYNSLLMNGKEVYKFAVSAVPSLIYTCIKQSRIATQEIDWLVLHQANERILKAVADRLELSESKLISNLSKYGNTSSASIPLVLHEALKEERIKSGEVLALAGFGAGLTSAALIIRWI